MPAPALTTAMILNKYISELVTCRDCGYADLQDYFRLYDFTGDGHDIHFICDPCYDKRCPAPLPESVQTEPLGFRERFQQNFRPTPTDLVGMIFLSASLLMLCLISVLAGGGK